MATAKKDWSRKTHQVVWADLEPWLQQLLEDHEVRLEFAVRIPMGPGGLKPAVTMEAFRTRGPAPRVLVKSDWRIFNWGDVGGVENGALHMASLLLLELENDKSRAELSQVDFFGAS